jgi:surfactin synthase thioesterase subunit
MNAYFLPFAGGSEISYAPLTKLLTSKQIQCYQCSLPGRGKRIKEPLLETVPELAEAIFKQLKERFSNGDYVLFGHSMGALLTVHVLSLIEKNGAPMPKHVFLSGRGGEIKMPEPPLKSEMDSETFRAALKAFGGLPDEILQEEAIMSFFEPIIKADFKAIEQYLPIDVTFKDLPVTVYYGTEDDFSLEQIKCWQRITDKTIRTQAYNGRHFFVLDQCEAIVDDILFEVIQLA